MTAAAKSRKPERLLLTVGKGALLPGDGYTQMRLRQRGYKMGDILLADLRKPRSPGFHRLAHRLGTLVASNIEDFEGLDGHQALKRLQWEARIACDSMEVRVAGVGKAEVITPRSLSYASMDQAEFEAVMRQFSEYIARTYWPDMTAEAIEEMAEAMTEAA